MDRLKWIDSTGGPLVLISAKSYKLWSGILNRNAYLENRYEDAVDFMDAEEADYGKACQVEEYLGVVDIGNDCALVLGDEPMSTTVLKTTDEKVAVVRWVYADNEDSVNQILKRLKTSLVKDWHFSLTINLLSDKQYLFDSAFESSVLEKDDKAYLSLDLLQGQYNIWTSIYEPDEKTRLVIHKFDKTN